ncbi:diguanylate cyclase domain-containing protein [Paraburkholderia caribensis]|uniref:diguanylate cyclase domain-containing protein n=1 Tax=Paraburkholderia caribensis TaxID=75105 RepID=UPI0007222790|nr:diguanylate cyclase [Paraburkholderia caribensis]ALP64316.1 deoxyuridine 5'-triphosphate nucleotidohydrolase [Paraburkholderia caribensis]AUT54544.1 sensor domain-containing diguanylate cyclase [Paraburkholderia caribensis]
MMRHGLTLKLSVLLALIGVLASGTTGYYAYRANRTMLVHEAERSLLTSTELLGQRFTMAINDIAADALVLSTMPSAATVALDDDGRSVDNPTRDRLAQVFESFIAQHPEYLQVRLIARNHYGLELIRIDRESGGTVRVQESALQEKGQFAYVFDTLALRPGRIYISPIAVNHEHGAHAAEGKPTLRVGTPVADARGGVVGVVVIDVDLASLLRLSQADLPADYQVYLANEWGDFLVHPDSSLTFGFDKGRRVFMQESFAATKALFEQSTRPVLLNGLTQPNEAANHVFSFVRRPFGESQGNRFIVIGLGKPLHDVLVGANMLGNSIVRMVLIFSAFAILLAILFARALTRPLHILADAATHFFSEHTVDALPLRRTDEIGVLARCFDRMRREIRVQMDELRSKQHELTHLASHDGLTGLPNRMLFMQKLEEAIDRARGSGERLAVLFIDLNRFKQINDQYGHSVGDDVLAIVARRLRDVLHSGDFVARLGGDEFIVLIRGERSADAAPAIAARIVRTLDDELTIDDQPMTVGASIGISQFPADGDSAEALLLNADAAMYAAKSGGSGAWVSYRELVDIRRARTGRGKRRRSERESEKVEPADDGADVIA